MLTCPACHEELAWNIAERDGNRIQTGEACCVACATSYPIQDGIGIFLLPDLPRNDLWEQADSELAKYFREHPDLERQLMESALDALSPADQFYRAQWLEEQRRYTEAKEVEKLANQGLYTSEYIACWESQMDYVVKQLSACEGPVVDLASGRCYLVDRLAQELERPVVATDFSPRVLRRDRLWLGTLGLYDRVSLLAFDARRTPFKDGAVETLTTNLGLANIEDPGTLLGELRRIVAGIFMAISHFYPEEDEANAELIQGVGLEAMLFQSSALECFSVADWQVEVTNVCLGKARPTPNGVLLQGAAVDGLPVAETELTWCTLVGNTEAADRG
jgi:uncharacterized protein YbaR (Trm112 family)